MGNKQGKKKKDTQEQPPPPKQEEPKVEKKEEKPPKQEKKEITDEMAPSNDHEEKQDVSDDQVEDDSKRKKRLSQKKVSLSSNDLKEDNDESEEKKPKKKEKKDVITSIDIEAIQIPLEVREKVKDWKVTMVAVNRKGNDVSTGKVHNFRPPGTLEEGLLWLFQEEPINPDGTIVFKNMSSITINSGVFGNIEEEEDDD